MYNLKKLQDNRNIKSICIVDNAGGAYLPIAIKLSQFFKRTYYYSVNQSPFPRISLEQIGTGYTEIIKVSEFWNQLNDFDIIMFPDIYFNDWGSYLRSIGKMVWGGCESEVIETNRKVFKDKLNESGLPSAPTTFITGLDNLKQYLNTVEDKWIKISYFRGEAETFHHINILQSTSWLNEMAFKMGPLSNSVDFMIEDPIDSVTETGYDGFTVNGKFPSKAMWGIEIKDCGYVGKQCDDNKLPTPIKYVNDKFESVLQEYNHTQFFSTEIRYTQNGTSYFTDPCMRAGSPPSNTMLEMIDNWDDIIIGACNNELVEPSFIAMYGVEIILKSNYCNEGYLNVSYPDEFKNNIKLKGSFKIDSIEYIIPFTHCGFDMVEFGSVVIVGDDLETIMIKALEIAGSVEGFKVEYNTDALNKAVEQLTNLQNILNIEF